MGQEDPDNSTKFSNNFSILIGSGTYVPLTHLCQVFFHQREHRNCSKQDGGRMSPPCTVRLKERDNVRTNNDHVLGILMGIKIQIVLFTSLTMQSYPVAVTGNPCEYL